MVVQNELDISQTVNDRILYLSGDIDNANVAEVCKQILSIIDYDRKCADKYRNYTIQPIQLYVQSFGGSINDMWALIDIIESSGTPIITYCSGYCMSAAALIFLAGHIRCMHKHSTMMFHQMTVGNVAKFKDFELDQARFEIMHKDMLKYIKKHTKLPKKFYKAFDERKEDVYLDAKKCLKYGICDEVVENASWREELLGKMYSSENTGTEDVNE